jgi:ribosomal protein S18 acetylase RimI-like enzyme
VLNERSFRWEEGCRQSFYALESSLPGFRRFAEDYLVESTSEMSCRFTRTIAIEPHVAALLGELGYPGTPELAARNIQRFLEGTGSRLQVAQGADGVVGLAATHVLPRLEDDQITCRITDIVVASAYRRSGVGTILLEGPRRRL